VQWIAFRVRLFAFYEVYCPHKLALVDKVVWEWKDAEEGCEDVMATLSRKYGREPDVSLQTVVLRLVEDPTGATAPPGPSSTPHGTTSATSLRSQQNHGGALGTGQLPPVYGDALPPPGLSEVSGRPTFRVPDTDAESFRGIPRVMSVSSMRSGGGGEGVPLTMRALETLNAPLVVNRSEAVARSLGQTFHQNAPRHVGAPPRASPPPAIQRSPSPDGGPHAILSVNSMTAAASAAGPGFGSTIGDVLRSFAFSVTFFDRFAAMYFPAGSGIHSTCDDPERVRMFQRLIRAYAPDEDAFYTTLIHRAEQRRAAEQPAGAAVGNVGATPMTRDTPTFSVGRASDGRPRNSSNHAIVSSPMSAAHDVSYEPSEPRQSTPTASLKFHVDPAAAWGQRSPPRHRAGHANDDGQSALTMLRRYQAQSQGSAAAPFSSHSSRSYNSRSAQGDFVIADDDLKAAIIEPLSSSIHIGPDGAGGGPSLAMLPPMFSAKRPDAYMTSSASLGNRNSSRNAGAGAALAKPFLRI
jgi:hypothetical protein